MENKLQKLEHIHKYSSPIRPDRLFYIAKILKEDPVDIIDNSLLYAFWSICDLADELEKSYLSSSTDVIDKIAILKQYAEACVDIKCFERKYLKKILKD